MIKNIIVTMEEKLLKLRDVDLRDKTRFVFLFFVNKSNRQRVVPGRQGSDWHYFRFMQDTASG